MTVAASPGEIICPSRALVTRAAVIGGIGSGLPSTIHAVATGSDVLEPTMAAGTILRPGPWRDTRQLAVGVLTHALLTTAWAGALTAVLHRRRRPVVLGGLLGAAIAALDLSIAQRRFPRIAALATLPQVADHVMFGALVGAVVARRESRRPGVLRRGPHRVVGQPCGRADHDPTSLSS